MKKIVLLFVASVASFCSFSQITITNADMPNTDDTIRYSITADLNDYTLTDTNYTWDFSTLTPTGQDRYEFKSALAINPLYVLSFGFFAYGVKLADSIGGGPIVFKDVYNFYKKSSSKYTIEGYGAEFTGIPIPATYSDVDEVYQFPLNYGRKDTSTFDVTISVPTVLDLRQKGTRYNEVDGWGSITTPYGTFNAIRLKSFVDEIDSITISLFPTPFAIPRTTTTYKWLCNGEKIPVLEVQGTETGGTFVPTTIRYRDNYRYIAPLVFPVADFVADKTICGLVDTVYITNNTAPDFGTSNYQWTVTPSTCVYINGTTATSLNPNIQFSAYGLYSVELRAEIPGILGAAAGTDTLTKTDYILVRDNTGIERINPSQIVAVYPNPTTDELRFDLSIVSAEIQTINLFNSGGVLVKSFKGLTNDKINVLNLSTGTYTIELIDKNSHSYYSRFLKK